MTQSIADSITDELSAEQSREFALKKEQNYLKLMNASANISQEPMEEDNALEVRMPYLLAFTFVYGLGMWHVTWTLAGNSQTTDVFKAKYEWTEDETITYNTIISSAGIVGLTVGCIFSGSLIKAGRRKAAIVAQTLAIIGSLVTMLGGVAFFSIGRVILGAAAGCQIILFGKSINENMPEKLGARFAMFVNASVCLGFLPCYGMGAILPDPEDFEANKVDEKWRVIFLVPAIIGVFSLIMLLLVFREEPITYCIVNARDEEAIRHMKKVYRFKNPDQATLPIEEVLKKSLKLQK